MAPHFNTPKEAVSGLIEAYRTCDVDQIVASKDFDIDSRLFWQDMGLPVSARQVSESRDAFEANFRKELEEGIPDYRAVTFRFSEEQQVEKNLVLVSVVGTTPDKQTFELTLPVFLTDNGWKVVLHPEYDQL